MPAVPVDASGPAWRGIGIWCSEGVAARPGAVAAPYRAPSTTNVWGATHRARAALALEWSVDPSVGVATVGRSGAPGRLTGAGSCCIERSPMARRTDGDELRRRDGRHGLEPRAMHPRTRQSGRHWGRVGRDPSERGTPRARADRQQTFVSERCVTPRAWRWPRNGAVRL